jgi:hypothetical protein
MAKEFKKTLLLCPKKYSLFNSFTNTLELISDEVIGFDVRTEISSKQLRIDSQMFRFPNKIRAKWEYYFLNKINQLIIDEFRKVKPDLVFIYNSEYLLPETCEQIKKNAQLIFFMGDSPFYTPVNNYYLTLLQSADLVLAPDSFWIEQLNTLGISRTSFFISPIDSTSYFSIDKNEIEKDIPEKDILYIGMCYVNSWGYKKALLMNQFKEHDLKIFGNSAWKRWFNYFPGLESKFVLSNYIETSVLNKMMNKAKLIPVDGNPAIINGIHLRAFEALGAGALPLIEYRKDVAELIFKDFGKELPIIRDYSKASEVASYYLRNETERKDLAVKMKEFVNSKYNFQNNADLISQKLKK